MDILDLSIKLNIDVPSRDLIILAENAYDLANNAQARYAGFSNPEIHIWVEQGSTKYRTKIAVTLMAIYTGISGIDGFVGGLEKIYDYSNKVMNYITEKTVEPTPFRVMEVKRSAGFPEKLKKILSDVHQGKLSPDSATGKVIRLIEADEADEIIKTKFLRSFTKTAEATYRLPGSQLNVFPEAEILVDPKSLPSKKSLPKAPPVEASLQGVELWYDRKTGNKEIKVYTK